MLIQKFKKIQINVTKQKEHNTILLFNIAYIIDYSTKFVSMNIVKDKKYVGTIKQKNSLKTKNSFAISNITERHNAFKNNTNYCIKQKQHLYLQDLQQNQQLQTNGIKS